MLENLQDATLWLLVICCCLKHTYFSTYISDALYLVVYAVFDTEADYHSCCVQMATQDLRVLQCLGDKSKVLLFWNRKLYTINQFLSGRPEQTVLDALDFATILRG